MGTNGFMNAGRLSSSVSSSNPPHAHAHAHDHARRRRSSAHPSLVSCLVVLFLVVVRQTAHAGAEGSVINWGTPATISNDSDVRTDGALVAAFNMNGPAVTVNGVPFASWTFPFMATTTSMGNFTITESPGHLLAQSTSSNSAPFTGLSSNYQTLLGTAVSTDDNNTLTLTITGLTLGQTYEFQWWLNASQYAGGSPGFRTTASAPLNVTLDDNTTNQFGGVGQTVAGTFFAGDVTEVITFNGADSTQAPTINAFQLRAVPEPSTLALLACGGILISSPLVRRPRPR